VHWYVVNVFWRTIYLVLLVILPVQQVAVEMGKEMVAMVGTMVVEKQPICLKVVAACMAEVMDGDRIYWFIHVNNGFLNNDGETNNIRRSVPLAVVKPRLIHWHRKQSI